MTDPQKPKIIFLKVADNTSKMARICDVVQGHFQKGEAVLLSVPNGEAARYLDQLLWKFPEESFLPHVVTDRPVSDLVVISMNKENFNNSAILFNLNPHVNPIYTQFQTVYELFDETHPDKLRLSQQRVEAYRDAGHVIN